MVKLKSIQDLKPAPYNPRSISKPAQDGLSESLHRFGDISGIVWNQRTGHLVSGHQRVAQLKARGATLKDGALQIKGKDGVESFPVRVVDWDEAQEHAANLTANNPHIGGVFDESLDDLLIQVVGEIGEIGESDAESLRLLNLAGGSLSAADIDDVGDVAATPLGALAYSVVVDVDGPEAQVELQRRLEAEGYTCRVVLG
jgi:hypothetical protein